MQVSKLHIWQNLQNPAKYFFNIRCEFGKIIDVERLTQEGSRHSAYP
jgi:hypothetical protein